MHEDEQRRILGPASEVEACVPIGLDDVFGNRNVHHPASVGEVGNRMTLLSGAAATGAAPLHLDCAPFGRPRMMKSSWRHRSDTILDLSSSELVEGRTAGVRRYSITVPPSTAIVWPVT